MSKRPRDGLPEPPLRSDKRLQEKNAPALGGDTYRPNYDHHRPNVVSPGTSEHDGSPDKPRRPMQQLRQMKSPPRPRESVVANRLNGNHTSQNHTSAVAMNNDFSGVPRGPKRSRGRPSYATQQKAYEKAVDENNPDVIPHEDLARQKQKPHIFISSSHLPFMPVTIPHLRAYLEKQDSHTLEIKADLNGYYVFFPNGVSGRKELQRCFDRTDNTTLFGEYSLHMELCLNGDQPRKRLGDDDVRGFQASNGMSGSRPESLLFVHSAHLRAKADDEMSISSVVTPSEISSGTTRARTHCAECKTDHFAHYNPKIACSTCPRHYHEKCRKPKPHLSDDRATWQCNYCFKKGRPKPKPVQRNRQTENSGRPVPVTQNGGKQIVGQVRMGVSARSINEKAQANESGAPKPLAGKSPNVQSEHPDPQLRSRTIITDPRLRGRAAVHNEVAKPPELHKHSSDARPVQEEQHVKDAITPGSADPLRNTLPRSDTQVGSKAPSATRHAQHPVGGAEAANPSFNSHVGMSAAKDPNPFKWFGESDATETSSEGDAEHALPRTVQQADLQPEIPDLSLDIAETASEGKQRRPDEKTTPIVSNDSQEAVESGATVRDKKRNSRIRCSTCGKTVFCAPEKAEEATCASCRAKPRAKEDGLYVAQTPVTTEEFWRRRFQPVQTQMDGFASPITAKADAQPSNKTSKADVGEQPTHAEGLALFQGVAVKGADYCDGNMSDGVEDGSGRRTPAVADEVKDAEASDSGGGPSAETKGLERRSYSPVNKTINNDDDAGMESDNAHAAINFDSATDPRSDAASGVQSADGCVVSGAPVKLPDQTYYWPELIGFALSEANHHCMTAAQVHEWIANNVMGKDISSTGQRSSIAATLSQQKVRFPKADPIKEGTKQLLRWKLPLAVVSTYKDSLKIAREKAMSEVAASQAARNGSSQRRKELNDASRGARGAFSTTNPRQAPPQRDSVRAPPHTDETPMFILRHRVAYDTDGRDIVAGFKDVPIEKWTQLAELEWFRKNGKRFHIGDYIKAPLPNRFTFADYTHKPLVQTIAQIEEIRQRRDGPGYAILVQWFITREAADWWKCRQVKSLWPKDESAGTYVPATVWHILTSDFVSEQERVDAEEIKRQIIPNMFFQLDTDNGRLYLKEGRGPRTGVAFGPRSSDDEGTEAEIARAASADRPKERLARPPNPAEHLSNDDSNQPRVTLRTKPTALTSKPSEQQSSPRSLGSPHTPHKRASSALSEARRTEPLTRTSPISAEQELVWNPVLERELFTQSPPQRKSVEAAADAPPPEHKRAAEALPTPTTTTSTTADERPAKRQKTGVTPEEQAAIRAFIRKEQDAAKYETKDLFAAAPEYDPDNNPLWNYDAKLAEIKARPSRKARFTKNLAYVRRARPPHALYAEVDRPLPKTHKALRLDHRPGTGSSSSSASSGSSGYRSALSSAAQVANLTLEDDANDDTWHSGVDDEDEDMLDGDDDPEPTQATVELGTQASAIEGTPDPEKPVMYDTLEEMLGLPTNFVPTLYEGRLAFRDGTMGLDGRLPRAKKIWKVGRNVPGELM